MYTSYVWLRTQPWLFSVSSKGARTLSNKLRNKAMRNVVQKISILYETSQTFVQRIKHCHTLFKKLHNTLCCAICWIMYGPLKMCEQILKVMQFKTLDLRKEYYIYLLASFNNIWRQLQNKNRYVLIIVNNFNSIYLLPNNILRNQF